MVYHLISIFQGTLFFGGVGAAALGALGYLVTQGETDSLRNDLNSLSAEVYGTTTTASSASEIAQLQAQLDMISATLTGRVDSLYFLYIEMLIHRNFSV